MKKISLAIISTFALLSTISVFADCSSANNYCGGTVYRCDVYCTGNAYNHDYCQRNCAGWTSNRYVDNTIYYYPTSVNNQNYSYNNYRYNNTYYYNNYDNGFRPVIPHSAANGCYYDINDQYRCDNWVTYQANPSWYPKNTWFWSSDDLALMTRAMNFDSIESAKQPDYFSTNVIGKDNNRKRLQSIKIKSFSFKNEDIATKHSDSRKFLEALKDATWQRYTEGVIKNYQMADITRDLGDMVGDLNDYFTFAKQYEKTGNSFYDDLATEKLDDVKQDYDRLKGSLAWRN